MQAPENFLTQVGDLLMCHFALLPDISVTA
jgi:hypothetical protein